VLLIPSTVHPFFSKNPPKESEPSGPFKWLAPLGKNKTCLHGVNLQPKAYSKIAAFDLDGTVIKFSNDNGEWQWWNSVVPTRLREVAQQGYTIVFFSNQAIKPLALKRWKEKIISIATAVSWTLFSAHVIYTAKL
jgi:bifunctional polynucleotide phosphatase/kinase